MDSWLKQQEMQINGLDELYQAFLLGEESTGWEWFRKKFGQAA